MALHEMTKQFLKKVQLNSVTQISLAEILTPFDFAIFPYTFYLPQIGAVWYQMVPT